MNLTLLTLIGSFIGIIIFTFAIAYLANRFFIKLIERSSTELNSDPTNYKFLRHVVIALIYIVGFSIAIYTIPSLRTLAGSLLAGAGIFAVAIGFASQQALSNIVSGFFVIVFKPFRINDRLKIRELSGVVEDITLRHTVIRDFENKRIIIPNAVISDEVIVNSDFGEGKICRWVEVGISYDSNIDLAKKIIKLEVQKHPLHIDPRTLQEIEKGEPAVPVRVILLGESSVNLRAWAWAKNSADAFILGCDLNESIKKRFDAEGIEIPYPHRSLLIKSN